MKVKYSNGAVTGFPRKDYTYCRYRQLRAYEGIMNVNILYNFNWNIYDKWRLSNIFPYDCKFLTDSVICCLMDTVLITPRESLSFCIYNKKITQMLHVTLFALQYTNTILQNNFYNLLKSKYCVHPKHRNLFVEIYRLSWVATVMFRYYILSYYILSLKSNINLISNASTKLIKKHGSGNPAIWQYGIRIFVVRRNNQRTGISVKTWVYIWSNYWVQMYTAS